MHFKCQGPAFQWKQLHVHEPVPRGRSQGVTADFSHWINTVKAQSGGISLDHFILDSWHYLRMFSLFKRVLKMGYKWIHWIVILPLLPRLDVSERYEMRRVSGLWAWLDVTRTGNTLSSEWCHQHYFEKQSRSFNDFFLAILSLQRASYLHNLNTWWSVSWLIK